MSRSKRILFVATLGGLLLLPWGLQARDKDPQDAPPDKQQDSGKKNGDISSKPADKTKNLRKLEAELASPYKKWLEEEVPYIITGEERAAFLQLQTNEERENFIEMFWQRRNPDPDSAENEFKEEYYRRIAYANEKFTSGVAGWKTDRGRIYIQWGPPDAIEETTAGSAYVRPTTEGGGTTTAYGFQDWHYRHLDGIGDDITLEFVDPTSTGEYHLTMDPGEKDAMAKDPGAMGNSFRELNGTSTLAMRNDTVGINTAPCDIAGCNVNNQSTNEFNKLDLYAKALAPPPVKFKDLAEVVSSRILRNEIAFTYRYDFLRVAGDSMLVPVTIQIQNKQMSFRDRSGVRSATAEVFARISTLSGRVIQTFEDTIQRDFPDSLSQAGIQGDSIYQKAVVLRPGLYKIDVVIKDMNSGNIGVLNERLAVPAVPEDKLDASTLILADLIETVGSKDVGIGMFVIGSTKVRPKLGTEFREDQPIGFYLQLYNLSVDPATHKNNLSLDFKISQGGETFTQAVMTGEQLQQTGEQVTFKSLLTPGTLPPGKYKLDIQATDLLNKASISRSADFTVTPLSANNTATANKP